MIAALLSSRLRRWLLAVLLAPVAGRALDKAAEQVAQRRGETDRTARALRYAGHRLQRRRGVMRRAVRPRGGPPRPLR